MRKAWVLYVALIGAGGMPAAQQPSTDLQRQATASIRGVVLSSGTSAPIRRATIEIAAPGVRFTAITDGQGRFSVDGLPGGALVVTATKGGFITMAAGQQDPSRPRQSIQLSPGQALNDVVIRLPRGSALAGRILDEFGDPVVNAYVQAFRAQYVQNTRQLTSVADTRTNDLGEYRLFGLTAGRYYVASTLQLFEAIRVAPAARAGSGFAATFFPGTVASTDAQAITLNAGADRVGLDFALAPVRLVQISGRVTNSSGTAASAAVAMLIPARKDRASFATGPGPALLALLEPPGQFTLSNVPPGEYRLEVRSTAGYEAVARGGGIGQLQGAANGEWASVPIVVAGEDIEGLAVTTRRGFTVRGRVVAGSVLDPQLMSRLEITAQDPAASGTSAVLATTRTPVQADGTFQLSGVSGLRVLRVTGLPPAATVKSIRTTLDIADQGVDVSDDMENVIVELARPTHVSGVLTRADGQSLANQPIIVFSTDASKWALPFGRFVVSRSTGQDGTFALDALPPGEYYAVGVDALEDGEWAESEFLRQLQSKAVRFTLGEGESKQLTLKMP